MDGGDVACRHAVVCVDTPSLRFGGGYCRVCYAPASIAINDARLLALGVAPKALNVSTSCVASVYAGIVQPV